MISKLCEECGKEFTVIRSRATTAKFCSTICRDLAKKAVPNQTCTICGSAFHMKQSQINRYSRNLGIFCSNVCAASAKTIAYAGDKNPNYKARNTDQDGYRIFTPQASFLLGLKRMKLHQAVCCEVLQVTKIPKGPHIHHRDCDITNNSVENLVVLNASDHKWIHKQYGVSTLWAYCHSKVTLDELVSWSDDKERALRILPLKVTDQNKDIFNESQNHAN